MWGSGRAEEWGRISAQTIVRPTDPPNTLVSTQVRQFHDVTTCSTAAERNPWVSSCVLTACGFAAEPKVTFPRAAPRFPTGFPLRWQKKQGVAPHLGIREQGKVEIPKWNINNNDSGRSDKKDFHSRAAAAFRTRVFTLPSFYTLISFRNTPTVHQLDVL